MAQQLNGWNRGTWGQLAFGEGDLPVPTTGLAGTTGLGSVISTGAALTGVTGLAGAGAIGQESATGNAEVAVTNVIGTTAVNSVSLITNNILPITLGAATGALGDETVQASANAHLDNTNILATGVIADILVWSLIDDSQTPNYSAISTTQTPSWSEVA